MAAALNPESFKEAILFLGTAGIVVPLFHRLRISPVLGFLGAGALLGPYGLGRFVADAPWLSWITISEREEFAHLAEFGVVFLLFMIGLELSLERLRTLRRLVFGLGSLQVLLSTAAIGAIVYAFSRSLPLAAVLGFALAMSSTAIVIPLLSAQKRFNTPTGRTSLAILLFQDLAVAPVLFVIAAVGGAKTGNPAGTFAVALLQAAVALVVIVGLGRLALRPLFHLVAATRSPELFMAACLLVVVTTSMFAAVSGLSMALGAFIAGLLLAETEYRRAIEAMINPFQGLLLGVFFVSVGMGLDLTRLIQSPVVIIGAALGLIGLKAAIIHGLGRLFHVAPPAAAESGLLLGPGGEFAFVIVGAAATAGLLREEPGQQALVIATVSMVALPALARLGQRINRRLRDKAVAPAEPPPAPEPGGVIVAGYGRVGQLVGEMLKRHNVPYLAIDLDATRVRDQRNRGNPVYFGDSANPEFLRSCGIETARALVVTLDSARAVEAVVAAARAERRDLTIVARARDARHAMALYELGVDDAVPENFEASLQLSEAVLVDIGVPMGLVIASVHERRDEFRNTLKRVDDTGAVREPEFRGRRTTRVAKGG